MDVWFIKSSCGWMNMTEDGKHLRNKSQKYLIRDEIEAIVKEKGINRKRFYEYSKYGHIKVVKAFYYAFMDYKKYPKVLLEYAWLHLRKDIQQEGLLSLREYTWEGLLYELKKRTIETEDNKYYLILSQGWVYVGYPKEIFTVLNETEGLIEDFYVVSRKFDWVICYCDDGECAGIYRG